MRRQSVSTGGRCRVRLCGRCGPNGLHPGVHCLWNPVCLCSRHRCAVRRNCVCHRVRLLLFLPCAGSTEMRRPSTSNPFMLSITRWASPSSTSKKEKFSRRSILPMRTFARHTFVDQFDQLVRIEAVGLAEVEEETRIASSAACARRSPRSLREERSSTCWISSASL